jgi:hypothetical protein
VFEGGFIGSMLDEHDVAVLFIVFGALLYPLWLEQCGVGIVADIDKTVCAFQ